MERIFHPFLEVIAATSLAAWIYLAFFRGSFWRVEEAQPHPAIPGRPAKTIVALIPARDEAALIDKAVTSLLTQNYRGRIDLVVVDDGSSDGTRQVALAAAEALQARDRLVVLSASPPPPGWTGKVWALSEGLRHVHSEPDYFLFSDADIVHWPGNVNELVARAESQDFDLVSLLVKLRCSSVAERALLPAFLFFFFMLYPPAWVSQKERRTAAAAGGCILLRPWALSRIGGISSIREELIDDCALAKRLKQSGARIYLGATTRTASLRPYQRWSDAEQMIARTAFTELGHSTALLVSTLLVMTVIFLLPPALLLAGGLPFWMGALAWLLMLHCFWPSIRLYRVSPLWTLTLPAVTLFYLGATVHSAFLYWKGRGGLWKGRIQDSLVAWRTR